MLLLRNGHKIFGLVLLLRDAQICTSLESEVSVQEMLETLEALHFQWSEIFHGSFKDEEFYLQGGIYSLVR